MHGERITSDQMPLPFFRNLLKTSRPLATGSEVVVIIDHETVGAVYITPHFILSPGDLLIGRGLVDVKDRSGHSSLGLIAAVDERLGLALIQTSKKGQPIAVHGRDTGGMAKTPGGQPRTREIVSKKRTLEAGSKPLIIGGKLTGFRMNRGPDIGISTIQSFLDQQRDVLSIDRQDQASGPSRQSSVRPPAKNRPSAVGLDRSR